MLTGLIAPMKFCDKSTKTSTLALIKNKIKNCFVCKNIRNNFFPIRLKYNNLLPILKWTVTDGFPMLRRIKEI